ncbi:MAG: hypothetical protein ACK52U_11525 [Synechococcaceae cyanobacterium]
MTAEHFQEAFFISLPLFTLMIQQGKLSSISGPVFTTMAKEKLKPEIRSLIQSRLRLAQDFARGIRHHARL